MKYKGYDSIIYFKDASIDLMNSRYMINYNSDDYSIIIL